MVVSCRLNAGITIKSMSENGSSHSPQGPAQGEPDGSANDFSNDSHTLMIST